MKLIWIWPIISALVVWWLFTSKRTSSPGLGVFLVLISLLSLLVGFCVSAILQLTS